MNLKNNMKDSIYVCSGKLISHQVKPSLDSYSPYQVLHDDKHTYSRHW